jgi:hypothetical protein
MLQKNPKHKISFVMSFVFSWAKNPLFIVPIHPKNSIKNFAGKKGETK